MYRPQFPCPAPPPSCEDQTCLYSWDQTNLPALTGTLGPRVQTGRIPLRVDKDADFYARAFSQNGALAIRIEDTDGNALSDSENADNDANFVLSEEYGLTGGAGFVVWESGAGGIFSPAGGSYALYLFNSSTTDTVNLSGVVINLIGVKRYKGGVCK